MSALAPIAPGLWTDEAEPRLIGGRRADGPARERVGGRVHHVATHAPQSTQSPSPSEGASAACAPAAGASAWATANGDRGLALKAATELVHEMNKRRPLLFKKLPSAAEGIARALALSESAVKFHLRNLFRKLGVRRRAALLERRGTRPAPARDGKVVTSWNALAIEALVIAARVFERDEWLAAALTCAAASRCAGNVPGTPHHWPSSSAPSPPESKGTCRAGSHPPPRARFPRAARPSAPLARPCLRC